jgi:ribosomal protein S18 acetylase RimI-like enzyme
MSITIRDAALTDAPTIIRFNALMAKETEDLSLDETRLRKGVEAVLLDDSKGFYCVAEIDGRIVGQLMITYEWSDWRNAIFWWIQSVYVEKDVRSKGVFRELYRHVETMARGRKNVCGLRLYVEDHNERAQHTYEHLGMHHAKYRMMEIDFVL